MYSVRELPREDTPVRSAVTNKTPQTPQPVWLVCNGPLPPPRITRAVPNAFHDLVGFCGSQGPACKCMPPNGPPFELVCFEEFHIHHDSPYDLAIDYCLERCFCQERDGFEWSDVHRPAQNYPGLDHSGMNGVRPPGRVGTS
ncbi:MAG: hypothetical protein M1830_007724 [Pleopsidium flavum]|nr:MAG: hypothetical protein M1830_007724 [Pleopsidium flavum]